MTEPTIALVFSPEPWVERLHRHLADHGGARVRQVVVDPRVALDEEFDTLVVSHRWPALNPGLVTALHARGRRVLGVFDLAEPAGHEHLTGLGIDSIVGADATMDAFVEAITELGAGTSGPSEHLEQTDRGSQQLGRVLAVGGTSGSGATELSIEIAHSIARSGSTTVLVDLDEALPTVVPRLGLTIEPNLRTAIDGAVYDHGAVSVSTVVGARCEFGVLGGLPSAAAWSQVRCEEMLLVLEKLACAYDTVVANVGSRLELVGDAGRDRFAISRSVVGIADAVVTVASGTPVGVVRAVTWVSELRHVAASTPLYLVVNRAPKDAFRRSELSAELARSVDAVSIEFVPDDRRVDEAAWTGELVTPGPFTRAIERLAGGLAIDSRRRSKAVPHGS